MTDDTGTTARRQPMPWGWLAPSLLLLGAMAAWGAVRYPHLPGRVPLHIGPGGVDDWTAKNPATALLPLIVYAGLTLVVVACAAGVARVTPQDAVERPADRWARAAEASSGRPASAASVRRLVRALLAMNGVFGLAFLPMCWVHWRGTVTTDVPGWILPGILAAFVVALVPLGVAWWRDAEERRTAPAPPP